MTMIERMARAIDDAYDVNPAGEITNLNYVARAVLAAMREPTPEMVVAGIEESCDAKLDRFEMVAIWQAMIDAA